MISPAIVLDRCNKYLQNLSFQKMFIIRLLLITSAFLFVLLFTALYYTLYENISFTGFISEAIDQISPRDYIAFALATTSIILFHQYERLIGPNKLKDFFTGRYITPTKEERTVMFLDLNRSTYLAETLSETDYYNFLSDFFNDLTEPVLTTSAEIYQYVGDEVVITWKKKKGLKNHNCLKLFFLMKNEIQKRKTYYKRRYNLIPTFKAGVHIGDVITAEIGKIKREIIYNGDVLNVAARLRSQCHEKQSELLTTKKLIDSLPQSALFKIEPKGDIILRGKTTPAEIYSVSLAE